MNNTSAFTELYRPLLLLQMVQTVCSIILIFLFLLAVRDCSGSGSAPHSTLMPATFGIPTPASPNELIFPAVFVRIGPISHIHHEQSQQFVDARIRFGVLTAGMNSLTAGVVYATSNGVPSATRLMRSNTDAAPSLRAIQWMARQTALA